MSYYLIKVGPQTHSFVMHKREHVQFEKNATKNSKNDNGALEDSIGGSIQRYGLHELQKPIKHHTQKNDSKLETTSRQ
jgi:hypothetical protein